MVLSGNIAMVTMKYSQPAGRPYGFEEGPVFKVNRLPPVSDIGLSNRSPLL